MIALEIRFHKGDAKCFADLQPRDAKRLKNAGSDDSASVLRRENNMSVEVVNDVGSDAETIWRCHFQNVAMKCSIVVVFGCRHDVVGP